MDKKEYFLFLISRIIATATKPLLIWTLVYFDRSFDAKMLSILFLTRGASMVLFNNEAYFYYYKERFKNEIINKVSTVKEELRYYSNFILHLLMISIPVTFITYFIVGDVKFTIPIFLYIVLDKIFDEIQRYLQFNKEFYKWSLITLVKLLIPFFLVLILMFFGVEKLFSYYLISLLFSLLIIELFFFNRKQIRYFKNFVKGITLRQFINYLHIYRNRLFLNQLQSLLTANILIFDRMLVRFFVQDQLSKITMLAQLLSIFVMFFDYFFIAHRRKDYVKQHIKVNAIISNTKLLKVFLTCVGLSFVIITLFHEYFINFRIDLQVNIIFLMSFYYAVFAITRHYTNYNFWNLSRKVTLSVDSSFFVLTSLILIILNKVFTVDIYVSIFYSVCLISIIWGISQVFISINKK